MTQKAASMLAAIFITVSSVCAQVWTLDLKHDSIYAQEILSRTSEAVEKNGGGQIRIKLTEPKSAITSITIDAGKFAAPTTFTLSKSSPTIIAPVIKWDFDKLNQLLEPTIEVITATATYSDGRTESQNIQTVIRPPSDCLLAYVADNGEAIFTWDNLAGYVNENDPAIDKILSKVIKMGLVDSWTGYQLGEKEVEKQIYAVWLYFRYKGIKYSSITTPSIEAKKTFGQTIRSFADTINNRQANCVDGSVLLASIFRKIGLDVFLVLPPGHCYLAVLTKEADSSLKGTRRGIRKIVLETTMIGNKTPLAFMVNIDPEAIMYNEMLKVAYANYDRDATAFNSGDKKYRIVHIGDARDSGILPIQSRGYVKF